MYCFTEANEPMAMPARSHEKPTSIDAWHCRFTHAGTSHIETLVRKDLVDGLHITKEERLPGMCKDCIYGKQTLRPYDERVELETEVLECVHVDLWGPAHVRSSGGALYMILFTCGGSSYKCPYFLPEKSGELVQKTMKEYKAMAELQTGKVIKRFHFDMGREFLNRATEDWCKEHGIIIETTTPY